MKKNHSFITASCFSLFLFTACNTVVKPNETSGKENKAASTEAPEYFNLRPKLEKEYGYTHAVRIGDDLKISGAVSMNDSGKIVAAGNMEQQMKTVTVIWKKYYSIMVTQLMMLLQKIFIQPTWRSSLKFQVSAILFTKNNFLQVPGWK